MFKALKFGAMKPVSLLFDQPTYIFSGTGRPVSRKLGMQYRGIMPIIVCSNDDPGVTLAY